MRHYRWPYFTVDDGSRQRRSPDTWRRGACPLSAPSTRAACLIRCVPVQEPWYRIMSEWDEMAEDDDDDDDDDDGQIDLSMMDAQTEVRTEHESWPW